VKPIYPGTGTDPLAFPASTTIPTYSGLEAPAPDDGRRQFARREGAGRVGLIPVGQPGPAPSAEMAKLARLAEALANAPPPPGSFGAFKKD
jgi:hypothetical protein